VNISYSVLLVDLLVVSRRNVISSVHSTTL